MTIQIRIQDAGQRARTRFYKDDPRGTEQVIDSINLLRDNPHQVVKWGAYRRMHVGGYRVLFQIVDGDPGIVSIEHVGR